MSQPNAEQALTTAKLKFKIVQTPSEVARGLVVAVAPEAGKKVAEGTTVEVKVSMGNLKLLPDVTNKGYDEQTAKAVLLQAGFTNVTAIKRNTKDPNLNGKVLSQNPAGNQPRDPTERITIQIGQYDAPPTTPPPTTSPAPPPGG